MRIEDLEHELRNNEMQNKDIEELLKGVETNLKELAPHEEEVYIFLVNKLIQLREDLEEERNQLRKKVEYIKSSRERLLEYSDMIRQINDIMPNLLQLLGSKSIYDVQESIKFLLFLHKTNIQSAEEGIVKMQSLIWNKEKSIREELLKTYWQLFFDDKEFKP